MLIKRTIDGVGIVAGAAAAVLWFLASKAPIPDDVDAMHAALRHASELNAWGAGAQCVAAICLALEFGYGLARRS